MSRLAPKYASISILMMCGARLLEAQEPVSLPVVTVLSERIANQSPASTFAAPVSALQFDPRVDAQTRNFTEAQADVSIRGGLFENTGFKLGATALFDPQTGHYFAELPVAPRMLTPAEILTAADNARQGMNANAGTVQYGWAPITARGEAALGFGDHATNTQQFYQSWSKALNAQGLTVGADVDLARSESDGTVPFGDHHFKRAAARVQTRSATTQTDVFAGWQKKFFGWPNLYTPFGFNETDELDTQLYAVSHRVRSATDPRDYVQIGAYYRRNFDDYEFNRAMPGASNPFEHLTRVGAVGAEGRKSVGAWSLAYDAQFLHDNLESTSLTFGRFRTRDYYKVSLLPSYDWNLGDQSVTFRAGATYDDTNRDSSALSPIVELSSELKSGARFYASYSESSQVATYTALNSSPNSGLFRGNPDLKRELSKNLEVGASFADHGGRWLVQAAIFRREDDRLVDWTYQIGVTARTANPVDIVTHGLELMARSRFGTRFDVTVGYTYLEKDSDYGAAAVSASFYALNFPRHRATVAFIGRLGRGFEVRLDNEWRHQEKNSLRTSGGRDAWLTALGIFYVPPARPEWELSLRVDNLWDDDFQEIPAVPASRRQTVGTLAYRW